MTAAIENQNIASTATDSLADRNTKVNRATDVFYNAEFVGILNSED